MLMLKIFIACYLLGSLSFAIITSKFMQMDDPRKYGSKNAGATNVMRSGNKKAAFFTLLGDLLKGVVAVLAVKIMMQNRGYTGLALETWMVIAGLSVIIGHIFPVFFKFKGGKGVATAIGVLLVFNYFVAILMVISWGLIFLITRISSLSAILANLITPIYAGFFCGFHSPLFAGSLIITIIIVLTHLGNIKRLVTNQEDKFKKKA